MAMVAGELPCSAQLWVTQGREGSLGLSVRNGNMGERGQMPRGEQDPAGSPCKEPACSSLSKEDVKLVGPADVKGYMTHFSSFCQLKQQILQL